MTKISMVFVFVNVILSASGVNAQFAFNETSQKQMVMTNLTSMPLAFTENQGQWNEKALFKAETGGATFWFCGDEIAYVFTRNTDELLEDDMHIMPDMADMPDELKQPRYKKESLVIRAQLIGANPNAQIVGEDRLSHNNNYFLGNEPSKWRTDVPNYSSIIYKNIYPGIDLKYHGNGQGMKYDFIVNPGADISQIQIRYEGADNLAITPNGDLEATTLFGSIHENIPSVYQEIGSGKREVTGRYVITAPGVFGFEVDDYNPSLTLVIDPELVYSTYLGGSDFDFLDSIVINSAGCAIVLGESFSADDYPLVNPIQPFIGGICITISKFSVDGGLLLFSTFLGGRGTNHGNDMAIDSSDYIFIAGQTNADDFPVLFGFDNTFNGSWDAVVAKIAPNGNSLIFSSYLGGSEWESASSIAVGADNTAYVSGGSVSEDFPMDYSYISSPGGSFAFLVRISSDGNSLLTSALFGGGNDEGGSTVEIDGSGYVYLVGSTGSDDLITVNAFDDSYNGSGDIFACKFSSDLATLLFSTYLGGSADEIPGGTDIDVSGNVYIAGGTQSFDFPTVNPYDPNHADGTASFITKLSSLGNSLLYSTFLADTSFCEDISVDELGNAYVIGLTGYDGFPTVNAYDPTYNGNGDIFISKLSQTGNSLLYSTYFGGIDHDEGNSIFVNPDNTYFISGSTWSEDFPTINAYDNTFNGGDCDGYVAKFSVIPNRIKGKKFNDIDGNCIQDPGEVGLPGWLIIANPGGNARITDANGDYIFNNLDVGLYTISEVLKPNWEQTCPVPPGTYTVLLNENDIIDNLNFGNRPLVNIQDLKIYVGGTRARSGFSKTYIINYENVGTLPVDATVTLTLPPDVVHQESSLGGIYNPVPHNVIWEIGVLAPGQTGFLWTRVTVPSSVPIGTALTSTAQIDPIAGDIHPEDNIDSETQIIRGSFDPNEKHVTPEGDIGRTDILTYHIDFQNVGNDTAFNIVVIDTLDPNLEMATMACGASSHSYAFDIIDRELTWTFADIYLPDSIVNEPGSHGFVEFSVIPVEGVPNGTIIENRASIYFDFNEPVVTNTVSNTIVLPGYPYLLGDVNMLVGIWPPAVTGPDVTYLVGFFRGAPTSHSCKFDGNLGLFWASADVNGDCNVIGSDVTKLVGYFRGQRTLNYCGEDHYDIGYYPPAWLSPADLPAEAPPGWPNCE